MNRSPVVVCFGGGVDSTAILVGLAQRGESADLVLFADTGGELPETYANVSRVSAWCSEHGLPGVTRVRRPEEINSKTGDRTLEDELTRLDTVPGEAMGRATCSIKWKQDPQNAYLFGRRRPRVTGWVERMGYTEKPTKLIGYDATETQSGKRSRWAKVTEDAQSYYRFPLVEWGWTRERCEEEIRRVGLPVPPKSACFFCPNQQEEELRRMASQHPGLFLRALAVEERARTGRHGLQAIEGLWRRTRRSDGRSGSWVAWARAEGLLEPAEDAAGISLSALVPAS